MGQAIAELGWPRWSYVISTKVYWGIHDAREHAATRSTASTSCRPSTARSSAWASTSSTSSTATGPTPRRPIEETVWAMSDIVSSGKALYWGTSEWSRRRDPRRVGDRRAPPPAQARRRAAAVQPVRAPPGRAGVRPPLRRHRARPHHLEPAGVGPAHRQVPRRRARRQPGRAARATSGCASGSPTRRRNDKVRDAGRRWPSGSTARCRSSPSPGARPTRTCRRVITGASRVEQVHENLAAIDVLAEAHPRRARRARGHHRELTSRKQLAEHLGTVAGWNSTTPSRSCVTTGGGARHPAPRRSAAAVEHHLRHRRRRADPHLGHRAPGQGPQRRARPAGVAARHPRRLLRLRRDRRHRRAAPTSAASRATRSASSWPTSTGPWSASTRTGTTYYQAMVTDERLVLRIHPERAYGMLPQ